jgi:hypothetical protein
MTQPHGQGSQNDRKYRWQRWITCLVCKEVAKPSDIHRRLYAICEQTAPAHSIMYGAPVVASEQHRMLSMSGTATRLKHAFVRPLGSDVSGLVVSMLASGTQVRGSDFSGRKYIQHAFLQRGSKAVGPMSLICGI